MAISNNSEQIKLLVVEDNPVIQFAITSMLEDLGYLFDTAKDGASAIKLALENNDYSLILMDIDLPDMSGIQVTEVLLSLQNTQYVPIVAITSHTEPEYIKRCVAARCRYKVIEITVMWVNNKVTTTYCQNERSSKP